MLVKFEGVWLNHPIWVNTDHVKTLRPATTLTGLDSNGYKLRFCVAGQTTVEYAGDGDVYDTVLGTLDEVAEKLNAAMRRQQMRDVEVEG